MARIVSTTSAGVPVGPQITLDALMQRQRDLMRDLPSANRDMQSPWQGAAYLGEVVANKLNQGRVDRQLAEGRAGLADAMAGINYDTGPTPEQIGQIGGYDPAFAQGLMVDAIRARREAANRERFNLLTPEEETQLGLDPAGSYQRSSTSGKVDKLGGGDTNITVGAAGDKKWNETGAAKFGERIDAYAGEGIEARRQMQNIDQLQALMQDLPTGLDARMTKYLRDTWGVALGEGASNLQAFDAIVSRLVPSQRPAGSGPMSDRDVELFKNSLPNYLNSPEGNRIILDTMRGIAQYNMQLGGLAEQALQMPDVSAARQFFTTEVNKLADPLAAWRATENKRTIAPGAGAPAAGAGAPTGAPAEAAPVDPNIPQIPANDMESYQALPAGAKYMVPGDPHVYTKGQ